MSKYTRFKTNSDLKLLINDLAFNDPGTVVSVARRNKQKPGTSIFNLDDGTKIEDIDQVVLKRYNLEQSEDIDDFIEITDYIGVSGHFFHVSFYIHYLLSVMCRTRQV